MKQTLIGVPMLAPPAQAPELGRTSQGAPSSPIAIPIALGRTLLGGHAAAEPIGPLAAPPSPGGTQIGFADPNPRAAEEAFGNEKTPALSVGALGAAVPPVTGPSGTFPGGSGPGSILLRVDPQAGLVPPRAGFPWVGLKAEDARFGGSAAQPLAGTPAHKVRIEPNPFGLDASDLAAAGLPANASKGGWVLVGVGAGLLTIALLFLIFWAPPRPIEGSVAFDPEGHEFLALTCADCADGTRVKLQGEACTFHERRAKLVLKNPLSVGENELRLTLERPGLGRDEEVRLEVPVRYRAFTELSTLGDSPPGLLVKLEAEDGATAVVDGQVVRLHERRGELFVSLERELQGQSSIRETLIRELQYTLTFSSGTTERGVLKPNLPIAPLVIEAPGTSAITDSEHFMLAGRTSPGGSVTVAGKPITVDPEGRFAQLMSVDSEGETKIIVRASLADHAPRLVPLKVRRTNDLRKVADEFRKTAVTDYGAVAKNAQSSVGLAVSLKGRVEEAKISGHSTVVLLDVAVGCTQAPCLARVVVGARRKLRPGTTVTVCGHLRGAVEGPVAGVRIPEVHAELVLE